MNNGNLRIAAAKILEALHGSVLPLKMRALKNEGRYEELRTQQHIPLWFELHKTATDLYNAAVVTLRELSGSDDVAKRALAVIEVKPPEGADEYVKAHAMWSGVERALRILNPDYRFDFYSAGERP